MGCETFQNITVLDCLVALFVYQGQSAEPFKGTVGKSVGG